MEVVPDLDDLMDNWFFGSLGGDGLKKKEEKGTSKIVEKEADVGGDKTPARLTQEWLQEAKKVVATSTTPSHSTARSTRLVAPPRFVSHMEELPLSSELRDRLIERRDPRSRSARRQRIPESVSSEILSKSSSRHRNSILSPSSSCPSSPNQRQAEPEVDPLSPVTPPALPPKQRLPRNSRFLKQPPPPPPRTEDRALSPPRYLVQSAHRRSMSATTCSLDGGASSPYRRSVSLSEPALPAEAEEDVERINAFLMRQKVTVERISSGEMMAKAKIVLSGSSSGTSTVSSMVAAICYAWLLENKGGPAVVAVPVINMSREKMWEHRQAGWLFHHLGIDASSLLFADEVDLEGLIMSRQLNMLVIGEDVLITKDEVGSYCTVLTDHYCEDAYNLLQCPNLKKLLLAGVLLDTQNLNSGSKFYTNRDAEAVQLLLVGSPPNYRQEFFEQLMRHHRSSPFLLAMKVNYGEPPNEASNKLTPSPSPAPEPKPSQPPPPEKAPEIAPRAKNKFSLAKFFGFGSK